jgi:2-polyprenyl-6-hydroxyphenyl methylase/3-demethylubiquinone-9 3-methyltransferase
MPSVNPLEIQRFAKSSSQWWLKGEYALLHRMNPTRVKFIRQFYPPLSPIPFNNSRFLDIGCGGGFLTESLARLGASVLGADATVENIKTASSHLHHKLKHLVEYRHCTAESLVDEPERFDTVTALEIIEHVNDPHEFVSTISKLVKPNGLIFISTINRTQLARILTIGIAEHILGWVPVGTHSFDKYIKPEELKEWAHSCGLTVLDTKGMEYNVISKEWSLTDNLNVNYIMACRLNSQD